MQFLDRKAEICILFWLASNGEDIGEVRLMGAKTSQSPTFYSPLLVIRVTFHRLQDVDMIEELGDSSYFLNSLALDVHDLSTIIF